MPLLTYTDDKSDKFYEIHAKGCVVKTRYGPITKITEGGTSKEKEFDSTSEAVAHVAKTVSEKLRSGYVDAGGAKKAVSSTERASSSRKAVAPAARPAAAVASKASSSSTAAVVTTANSTGHTERKNRVLVRVRGRAEDRADFVKVIKDVVRDSNITNKRDAVEGKHEPYYLRPRLVPANSDDQVDHIFECQMLAHSIFHTDAFHQVVGQVDLTTTTGDNKAVLSKQPMVVQKAIEHFKALQNCTTEGSSLFNLALLNPYLNKTKGAAIKTWLSSRADSSHSQCHRVDLRDAFKKSTAFTQHKIIDEDDLDGLADRLHKVLISIEDEYIGQLQSLAETSAQQRGSVQERRAAAARINGVISVIEDLQIEHENE